MKKITLILILMITLAFTMIFTANASIYVEEIPDNLKHSGDTVTHFIVIEGEEYYTGYNNTVNNFNGENISKDIEAIGISESEIGSKYLTKLIIPQYFNGTLVTYADINNEKHFKSNKYFANCGYLVFPSTVTKINDANDYCGKIRCIDFGVDSQITEIPSCFMQNAYELRTLLNMPKNLTSIGSSAFRNCSKLQGDDNKQLYINAQVINNKAFDNALTHVESIIFGENVKKLVSESFSIGERDASMVKYMEFKCDVTKVEFPDCKSGKYVGAFYFGTNDSQRRPYSSLVCIVLSNPAQAGCDGQTFVQASGQNVYFNNITGEGNFVYTSHNPSKEGATVAYEDFLSYGKLTACCTRCGKQETTDTAPMFACLGYSSPESGEMRITVGFSVNYEALAAYENQNGNSISFGMVAAVRDLLGDNVAPLDEQGNAVVLDKGRVISVNISEYSVSTFDFILTGITEASADLDILIATYVKETYENGEIEISYLQNKQIVDNKFEYYSYNSILQ